MAHETNDKCITTTLLSKSIDVYDNRSFNSFTFSDIGTYYTRTFKTSLKSQRRGWTWVSTLSDLWLTERRAEENPLVAIQTNIGCSFCPVDSLTKTEKKIKNQESTTWFRCLFIIFITTAHIWSLHLVTSQHVLLLVNDANLNVVCSTVLT